MRIPSGTTDQYMYFVAVDATDLKTRETGLSSFTVYRSRNGAAAAAMTTPTVNETDTTNMPGVYELLLDEDMTIGSGNDSEEMVFHITQASMAPVTRTIELYRPKITVGETITVSSGVAESNAVQISGDATAADNLEAMYDGTGYTDSTGPASRQQVENIGASSGGSVNIQATEDNTGGAIDPSSAVFVGSVQSGTFNNTQSEDGVLHDIDDTGNDIDIVYGFSVGGARQSTAVSFSGFVQGNGDEIKVKAYDHVGATWDIIATISGKSGTLVETTEAALLTKHTGTGSESGKTYIRFETDSTTPSNLSVDKLLVSAVNTGQSVGYQNGAVWIDTSTSNTNTESFVDGTADKPVSTLAAATTIAGNLNLKKFQFLPGSSVTLAQTYDGYEFHGIEYTLNLGSQDISNTLIDGAMIAASSATGTGTIFRECIFDQNITLAPCVIRQSFLGDMTITAGSAGNFYINGCVSRAAGSSVAPNFDLALDSMHQTLT